MGHVTTALQFISAKIKKKYKVKTYKKSDKFNLIQYRKVTKKTVIKVFIKTTQLKLLIQLKNSNYYKIRLIDINITCKLNKALTAYKILVSLLKQINFYQCFNNNPKVTILNFITSFS